MLSDLWYRLRSLFRRSTIDRELDDELRFHLEHETDRLRRAGVPADEAARRARLNLGGLAQVAEDVRDGRGVAAVDRLAQDGRYALRVLRRNPAFTLAVVLTLGLGIGATTAMFAVLDGLIFRALPYPESNRLVQIGVTFGPVQVESPAVRRYLGTVLSSISTIDLSAIQTRARTLDGVAGARGVSMTTMLGGEPRELAAGAVSASFFDLLGARPVIGRGFGIEHDSRGAEPVVVLSHALWRRHFAADPSVLGRALALDDVSHVVVGVLSPDFRGPDALGLGEAQLWIPLGRVRPPDDDRDNTSLLAIARLARGTDLVAAMTELDGLGASLAREHAGSDARLWIDSLRARTLGESDRPLWLLFGAVGVLLLIACANVANLFMVRATERTREIAVRLALGAGRGRVARQLLTESLVFGLAGGLVGLALANLGVALFAALAPADLPRMGNVGVDARVFAFALALSLAASVVFGLVPAHDATKANLTGSLRDAAGSVTAGRPRARLRRGLVVAQTTLALVLLVGGGLLANSLARLARVDLGFDTQNVVWLDVALPARAYTSGPSRATFLMTLVARTGAEPGVAQASFIGGRPLGGGNFVTSVAAEGRLPGQGQQPLRVPLHSVSKGYFETLAIPRLDGRDFDATDTAQSPQTAVVSRSFAERLWPGERAVGKRLWMGRVSADAPLTTVVGVVDDVRHYGLSEPGQPVIYRALTQLPIGHGSLLVRHSGRPAETIQALRRAAWSLDGALPLERYGTMRDLVRAALGEPRLGAVLLGTFGAIAVAFACVGLYGTLAWVVRTRRREMGIRLALGAGAGDLRRLVIGEGLRLAGAGIGLGVVAALLLSRLLTSLVYDVSTTDLPTFAVTAAIMAGVAVVACWIPARRAARLDPIETLREG